MPRALHLTATHHTVDGVTFPNPPVLWETPTLTLFIQMMQMVGGNGTILLHQSAAEKLALPVGQLPTGEDARKHPVVLALKGAGWKLKDVHRWFHVKHPDYGRAHIGLTEFFDSGHFPLIDTPARTTAAMAHWHDITGHAWTGSAGDAANQILRSVTVQARRGAPPRRPEFWSWKGPTLPSDSPDAPPRYPSETWYTPSQWRRAVGPEVTQISSLDRVRAYLGALTCTPVAAGPLEHTPGKLLYDRSRAGWWLVRLGPWEYRDLLPDPAGYAPRNDDDGSRVRWLSSPRLDLLAELAQRDEYGYEILDSWTAPATGVLKTFGTELRKSWQGAKLVQDPAVRALVRAGVKEGYRQLHGHWRSHQSTVQRYDWAAALVAQNAVNTWRRAYGIGNDQGLWPVQIDTDSLYYPGGMDEVAEIARAAGWTVWDGARDDLDEVTELGHWRTGRTLPYDPAEGRPARPQRQEQTA